MGHKTIETNASNHVKDSPKDSRVYDHYDYAFDEFETYAEEDFANEEARVSEVELGSTARLPKEALCSKEAKAAHINHRWETLKSKSTLQEISKVWFSQAPFDLEPDRSKMDWEFTQTDPETGYKTKATQTQQVAQLTVASMATDDLTTPADVPMNYTANHSFNLPHWPLRSSAQGCICVFDVLSKSSLQFSLFLQGVPLCAAWSTSGGRKNWGVIVGGTQDGSLALWDLSRQRIGLPNRTHTLQPTYSTNYRIEENHTAPTQSVILEGNSPSKEVSLAGSLGEGLGDNFLKLLSIDKLRFVHLWIVKEVQGKPPRDIEPGLHPEGRLYLVRMGLISVLPRTVYSLEIVQPEACTFVTIPGQTQEILVAMSDGSLVKTSLVGSKPCGPRRFTGRPKPVASPVLSLYFSPFVEDCFLVAHADNTVAIFTMDNSNPWGMCTMPSNHGHIISAQWSTLESTIFLVAVKSSDTCLRLDP